MDGNLVGDCGSGRMPMWAKTPPLVPMRASRARSAFGRGYAAAGTVYSRASQSRCSFGEKIGPSFSSSSPLSEFVCPSDRAAEGPRDGDGNQISSADLATAAAAPPLGLLPSPHRARVTGVSSAHHVEVGGFPAVSSDVASHSRLAIRGRCR